MEWNQVKLSAKIVTPKFLNLIGKKNGLRVSLSPLPTYWAPCAHPVVINKIHFQVLGIGELNCYEPMCKTYP